MLLYGVDQVCYSTGDPDKPYRLVKLEQLAREPHYISRGTAFLQGVNRGQNLAQES